MTTREYIALTGRLVVRVLRKPDMTKGGIYLSDGARKQAHEAVVYSVGNRPRTKKGAEVPAPAARGEHVLLANWWTGKPIVRMDDENLLNVAYEDVIAVVER